MFCGNSEEEKEAKFFLSQKIQSWKTKMISTAVSSTRLNSTSQTHQQRARYGRQ